MKYSKYSLNQHSNKKFKTSWQGKEGIFLTPQGKYIVRVKIKLLNTTLSQYRTLSQHETEEEAKIVYETFIKNKNEQKDPRKS